VDIRGPVAAGCLSLLLAAIVVASSAAIAGAGAPYDDDDSAEPNHGAIAYSPSTRAHGWSFDYASRKEADRIAVDRCRRHADDCIVAVRFRNGCGALAVGADGYGSGWGASRRLAERYALQSCSRYSDGCAVIRWVCTSPSAAVNAVKRRRAQARDVLSRGVLALRSG
jgi:serine/threonine-protein kinase